MPDGSNKNKPPFESPLLRGSPEEKIGMGIIQW